jgi:hypothetical protein
MIEIEKKTRMIGLEERGEKDRGKGNIRKKIETVEGKVVIEKGTTPERGIEKKLCMLINKD